MQTIYDLLNWDLKKNTFDKLIAVYYVVEALLINLGNDTTSSMTSMIGYFVCLVVVHRYSPTFFWFLQDQTGPWKIFRNGT